METVRDTLLVNTYSAAQKSSYLLTYLLTARQLETVGDRM